MACFCVLTHGKLVFIIRQLTQQIVTVEQIFQTTHHVLRDDVTVVVVEHHVHFAVIQLPQVVKGLVVDGEVICRTTNICVVNQVAKLVLLLC